MGVNVGCFSCGAQVKYYIVDSADLLGIAITVGGSSSTSSASLISLALVSSSTTVVVSTHGDSLVFKSSVLQFTWLAAPAGVMEFYTTTS